MKRQFFQLASITLIAPGILFGCAQTEPTTQTTDTETTAAADPAEGETGTLEIVANGEDFVRQGFVSKDGWQISFENVYVNLADLAAYQSDPAYDAQKGGKIDAKQTASIEGIQTVDLAAGDENADPIQVAEISAPAGQYNAFAWKVVPAPDTATEGAAILMRGTATKDGETVDFALEIDRELAFKCGEYVGDERKGIVQADSTGEVEATFHFDHLFGDGDAPADDEINTGALGFEPFAQMAQDGRVEVDGEALQQNLSDDEYAKYEKILANLGHVGEGHCHAAMANESM